MSVLARATKAALAASGTKARDMTHPDDNGAASWWIKRAGYMRETVEVGDGSGSGMVMAALTVLAAGITEPPLRVHTGDDDNVVVERNNTIEQLWEYPNQFMTKDLLEHYITWATHLEGNGYVVKSRDKLGRVAELWPLQPDLVEPLPYSKLPISHLPDDFFEGLKGKPKNALTAGYRYTVSGKEEVYIRVKDMVHFRYGLDPHNHRRGIAPLKTVLREILGDEEAGRFSTGLMRNFGVPGVILIPDEYDGIGPEPEQADAIKETYQQRFTGSHRGEPLVLSNRMKVETVSFSPSELDFKTLRRLPEERVCAVLGVPAIIAQLGAGLDHSSFANMDEAGEHFAERKLIPTWRNLGRQLTAAFRVEEMFTENERLDYDLRYVRALRQDQDALWSRVDRAVRSGWITIADGRQQVGLPTDTADEVYIRQDRVMTFPRGATVDEIQALRFEPPQETPEEPTVEETP